MLFSASVHEQSYHRRADDHEGERCVLLYLESCILPSDDVVRNGVRGQEKRHRKRPRSSSVEDGIRIARPRMWLNRLTCGVI